LRRRNWAKQSNCDVVAIRIFESQRRNWDVEKFKNVKNHPKNDLKNPSCGATTRIFEEKVIFFG